jgi:glycopeptide antibiotics resistance protein
MVEIRVYFDTNASVLPRELYLGLLGAFVVGLLVLIWWKGFSKGVRYGAVFLLAEWVFLVLCAIVFFRETNVERGYNLMPFWSYWDYGKDSYFLEMLGENILNVLLFLPIGFLAGCGLQGMTLKKVLFLGGGLSVFIELLQFIFKKGFCETDDVIHNVLGCLIGYGLWRVCCIRLHTS